LFDLEEIMEHTLSVREELAGKTEMNAENEQDLFDRLEQIEKDGQVVDTLSKADWIGILVAFFALGVGPLLYYAVKLF
jgi:hypothetical protein